MTLFQYELELDNETLKGFTYSRNSASAFDDILHKLAIDENSINAARITPSSTPTLKGCDF